MIRKLIVVVSLVALWGCEPNARGFVLPEGDVSRGTATFAQLNCTDCHSVGDIAWEGGEGGEGAADATVELPLGGTVTSLKTYGQLVTSVINPSHRIARPYLGEQVAAGDKSKMRPYNDVMTVQQLVDLVTYLQTEYEVVMPHNPYAYRSW